MRLAILTGTGRCGSTLLSNLVNLHPDVLSVSELFAALRPDGLSEQRVAGTAMWQILTRPRRDAQIMADLGLAPDEFLYPLASGRYPAREVPPIAAATLPHLTDRPDALLDELEPVVKSFPEDSLGNQYHRLFTWLCRRFDRGVVVERSGASLEYLADLHRMFPEAKVVHIWRDPSACALSMREHHLFRMGRLRSRMVKEIGFDPYREDGELDPASVPESLRALLPETFDRAAYERYPFAAADFGWQWSALVMAGLPTLKSLEPDQLHTLRYEDLLAHARTVLEELGAFLGLHHVERWAEEAAGYVEPPRHPARLTNLDAEEVARLDRSVSVASRSLRRFNASRQQSVAPLAATD